jgi:hypothetical protein
MILYRNYTKDKPMLEFKLVRINKGITLVAVTIFGEFRLSWDLRISKGISTENL